MSQFQQIRVLIKPWYRKSFERDFPRLFYLLSTLGVKLGDQDPSLVQIVPHLVRLSQEADLEPQNAEAINTYGQDIVDLYCEVEDLIGSWKLSQAEEALTRMDELYLKLEKALLKPLASP